MLIAVPYLLRDLIQGKASIPHQGNRLFNPEHCQVVLKGYSKILLHDPA